MKEGLPRAVSAGMSPYSAVFPAVTRAIEPFKEGQITTSMESFNQLYSVFFLLTMSGHQ